MSWITQTSGGKNVTKDVRQTLLSSAVQLITHTHTLHMALVLVQTLGPTHTLNSHITLRWRCSEVAGERGHKAEAGAPSRGRDGGREGLSSSHRSALSCFWTAVIPFLALLLKQFSLSSSPCHWKSRRWRVRSELLGCHFYHSQVCNHLLKWRP